MHDFLNHNLHYMDYDGYQILGRIYFDAYGLTFFILTIKLINIHQYLILSMCHYHIFIGQV